ncbi:hypothetical protein RE428_26920 [Marinobacter nanhaiticus D15-8W]|uniref:Uncharacterized protein n=1 Tax=Marinobacter nanhaiticus D15-8W TaxID=626887 RepID=N6WRX2_9GAMM|nr:hypothetical protein [Marinobacter nanhaiticus]ENO14286.1 hypothetical protein J057_22870 [Marinobacter nanhaiticus D15-8W]BES71674.1 hypothetical protein RE428_26920 [Marinobacter nanhaiticus D15-8W]
MRILAAILALLASTICWSTPITYSFSGYATAVRINGIDTDPSSPLVRNDGKVVTNGNTAMTGNIVFDPDAWRDGAGGSGYGQVFSWTFSTLGLTYHGESGAFHYLDFYNSRFSYSDELPLGGFEQANLPDVCNISFDFDNEPFLDGPAHFPIANFIGGHFFSALEVVEIDETRTMQGLLGVITDLSVVPQPVPGPSPLLLLSTGLLLLSRGAKRKRGRFVRIA